MTTDHDLRDLLTTEADGLTGPPADWDDIVRRGRHHRRVTRTRRGLTAGALAAAIAIGGFALLTDRPDEDRDDVIVNEPDRTVHAPLGFGPWISSASEGAGAVIVVQTGPPDPATDWDPCIAYRPAVTETAHQVIVTLVAPSDPDAGPWVSCVAHEVGTAGRIHLDRPLNGRHVIDGYNDLEIPVTFTSAAPVLGPTDLPAPLDPTRPVRDLTARPDASAPWTLEFEGGGLAFEISTLPYADSDVPCSGARGAASGNFYSPSPSHDTELVPVRGTTGELCSPNPGVYYLWFWEHEQVYFLRLAGPVDRFTQDDVIAIADGLEPLEEQAGSSG